MITTAWPEGNTWTIQGAAMQLGKTRKTIYNVLWENAKKLGPRLEYQIHRHKGDFRYYRILTEADMAVIRGCFRPRVK